ncbi:MAG: SdpI family protein [Marinilabiliales bacterium]|nr:SdpI family protein [Marinilabiliales bacterium]
MKKESVIREAILLLLTLLPILYLLINWQNLPESVPIHFDASGHPNGYGSRYVYLLLPIGLYLLLLLLPKIDPRKSNYAMFESSYYKIRLILILFIGMINSSVIWGLLHEGSSFHKMLPMSLFILFMLLGNYMSNVRPNYFVGIKVPWTLNSDVVWIKTHKLAGKLWFWGSLAGLIASFFVEKTEYLFIPLLVILSVVPVVYSYVIYQKLAEGK